MIVDQHELLQNAIYQKKRILVEGANGIGFDIEFGAYPYVTSSSTTTGSITATLGIPPVLLGNTIEALKAYTTRIAQGPFPTELSDSIGRFLQNQG